MIMSMYCDTYICTEAESVQFTYVKSGILKPFLHVMPAHCCHAFPVKKYPKLHSNIIEYVLNRLKTADTYTPKTEE